jgi:ribosomal protein S19
MIGPLFIDKKLKIYNGLKFVSFFLNKKMVGDMLGEYSISKIMGSKIAYSMRRKKKANRMKK